MNKNKTNASSEKRKTALLAVLILINRKMGEGTIFYGNGLLIEQR